MSECEERKKEGLECKTVVTGIGKLRGEEENERRGKLEVFQV